MSDDVGIDERPAAPVHFEHWCEEPGCSKWGGYGDDVCRGETPAGIAMSIGGIITRSSKTAGNRTGGEHG